MSVCDWFNISEPIQAQAIDDDGTVVLVAVEIESGCGEDGDDVRVVGVKDSTGRKYSAQENRDHFGIDFADLDAYTVDTIEDAIREEECNARYPGGL